MNNVIFFFYVLFLNKLDFAKTLIFIHICILYIGIV